MLPTSSAHGSPRVPHGFPTIPHTAQIPSVSLTAPRSLPEPAYPRRIINPAGDLLPMASTMKASQLMEVLPCSCTSNTSTIYHTSCAMSLFRSPRDETFSSKSTQPVIVTLTFLSPPKSTNGEVNGRTRRTITQWQQTPSNSKP